MIRKYTPPALIAAIALALLVTTAAIARNPAPISPSAFTQSVLSSSFPITYQGRLADAALNSTAANQSIVRASGGITMYTNSSATTGATLQLGAGSWSIASDRDLKYEFLESSI